MTLPVVPPNGVQRPRVQAVPLSNGSAGQEAIELAATAGLHLDPWQCYVLENSLGYRVGGKWAAREVGLIVSRQNGKGSILEARELAGLFLFGEKLIMHSAHQFKTSSEHFLRIKSLIQSTPDLLRKVKPRGIRESHGEEGIELAAKYGSGRLRFVARSINGSGRGFAAVDLMVIDEAFEAHRLAMKSLLPTQLQAPNPQTWYTSSVEDRGDATETLKRLRDRGRAGSGKSPNLAYFEWSAPDDAEREALDLPPVDADDLEARAQANPSVGIRLPHESLQAMRDGMDGQSFREEHLSVWPGSGKQALSAFGRGKWEACGTDAGTSSIDSQRCFAIAVSLDRQHAAICVAGRRADGLMHVEVVEHRPGTKWVAPRAKELQDRWGSAFALDAKGPASSLVADLIDNGVTPHELNTSQICDAYDGLFDAVQVAEVRHMNYPELEAAVAGAEPRNIGDRKTWGRKTSAVDITPLEAVTLAAHGSSLDLTGDYDIDNSIG